MGRHSPKNSKQDVAASRAVGMPVERGVGLREAGRGSADVSAVREVEIAGIHELALHGGT